MSLSLSSLLNPTPESENPPPPRKESLPPIHYVQSPEQQYATSPQSARPPQHQPSYPSYPPSNEHDAVHALAQLSNSSAPPPPIQTQWYPQQSPSYGYDGTSSSYEQRPSSSGYNDPVQLPPPPHSAGVRKPSSPTLDQYQVASRSPEQRRQSMMSPSSTAHPNFTLPPIHSLSQSRSDSMPQPLVAYQPPPALSHGESGSKIVQSPSSTSHGLHIGSMQSPSDPSHHGPSPTARAQNDISGLSGTMKSSSSPQAPIKQEAETGLPDSLPSEAQCVDPQSINDPEVQNMKAIASLRKNELGLRTHSPLRDSSVPVPSTETGSEPTIVSKKRPAPSKTKKGTATAATKKPPAKKRKVEPKPRSVTPSRTTKSLTFKTGSSKGTPANSSPAPSTRSHSEEAADTPYDDDDDMEDGDADGDDGDLYCICRKPDNGTFMIGCDGTCDDWFHGKCVGIEERDKNLIDKYVCPNCTKAGAGKTTWKRICRRHGCRQPARVGKTKGGKDGSKYCSEECGVLYFREMVARTRGREDTIKSRGSRRKNSIVNTASSIDYDLGARGGTLAAGELKSLINSSTTADDFKKLGEGVLSPPATPTDSKSPEDGTKFHTKDKGDYNDFETQALQRIHDTKEDSRRKHQLLKDRVKFVTMAKQAATRLAAEKELKPKDYCGYDSRLEWPNEQFAAWRNTPAAQQAFELETLAVEKNPNTANSTTTAQHTDSGDEDDDDFAYSVCDRKKCARHLEWTKLAVDDVRFEMSDNGDRMRGLEKEEREIKERAAMRAKAGGLGEGSVEVHGLGIEGLDGVGGGDGGAVEVMDEGQ